MSSPVPSPARPEPPRRRRQGLLPFWLVIGALVGVSVVVMTRDQRWAAALVANEDAALEVLHRVASAELDHRERAGRYGWIGDLRRAGQLDGLEVVETEHGAWIRAPGYRIDVLLPHADLGAGVIGIGVQGGRKAPDPELQREHFAVVARPVEPGRTGYRIWYLDERRELFLNEGVIDDEGSALNGLPTSLVRESMTLDTASLLLWQRASDIRPDVD